MNIKVTVIGSAPKAAAIEPVDSPRAGFKPTVFPGSPAAPNVAAAPAPAYKPTVISGANPASSPEPIQAPARTFAPTALKPSAPPVPVVAPPPLGSIKLSALPGEQRKAVDVPLPELARRFPMTASDVLQRAQAVLLGVHLGSMSTGSWINFGLAAQEEFSVLVKQRLELAQNSTGRSAQQHLSRLHGLLTEVLESFSGGFLRRGPDRVWAERRAEVSQLEQLLDRASDALAHHLAALQALRVPSQRCADSLAAVTLAAEYLLDHVGADIGGLLVARVASLTGSSAMQVEHSLYLEQDIKLQQELMSQVQNGVVLKLPAVYTQLAGIAGRPTETERFLAAEKLTAVLQSIQQRK
jgi:hypothetical protein